MAKWEKVNLGINIENTKDIHKSCKWQNKKPDGNEKPIGEETSQEWVQKLLQTGEKPMDKE